MADFISGFWSPYIAIISVVSMLACLALIMVMSKKRGQPEAGTQDTTGHVWDDNLRELNNPLPRWWLWLFVITIIFSLVYVCLYPALGSYKGSFGWTSTSEAQAGIAKTQATAAPLYQKYRAMDVAAVAQDKEARALGERLFLNNCAVCHGSDARGSRGYPNLTDKDWLYGGDAATIKATIMQGRNGIMPPQAASIGSTEEVGNVVHYVFSLSNTAHDNIRAQLGKAKFDTVCAACHGADGKGNQALGAPNLTDKTWLYGSSVKTITEGLHNGRNNKMPAFGELLGEDKVHLLAAYVYGLSQANSGK